MLLNNRLLMERCLHLAKKANGKTSPNPMVGSVIVHDNKIIGEGYHKGIGENHAEVEAINSVKNQSLLEHSTIYVNLEPCNHFGKTPPCSDLIIKKRIPKVVIGTLDPNPKVAGKGIHKLRESNVEVNVGILKRKCEEVNKRFFCYHQKKRPYITLKWAESIDGFISPKNQIKGKIFWITSYESRRLSHKWRSQEDSIAVGINTIINDNPELTCRYLKSKSPIPIIIDPKNKINSNSKVFKKHEKIFHYVKKTIKAQNRHSIKIDFKYGVQEILNDLYKKNINSILVEGGTKTIQSFIDADLWDEARKFIGKNQICEGVKSPIIKNTFFEKKNISDDILLSYINY